MIVHPRHRVSSEVIGLVAIALLFSSMAHAQATPPAAPAPAVPAPGIGDAWSGLLKDAIPRSTVDPTLSVPQLPSSKGGADDFLNHFYFDERTEYRRENAYFTGLPTATNVINAPFTGVFNPAGIPDTAAFQPNSNGIYSFIDFGTTGWGSDRVDSHFAVRYQQDLSHVEPGSPEQSILNSFGSNRLIEVLSANIDIHGKPTDGWFAGDTLTLGRQYIYGAEPAQIDGASFKVNRHKYSIELFAGRRFTYYSDPSQRVIGGANFLYRFNPNINVEYDVLGYIRASHRLTYRQRITPKLGFTAGYRMVGSNTTDATANLIWTPGTGSSTIRLGYWEKLSDRDYIFDFTENARDVSTANPMFALNLGPLTPFSQFIVDARRSFLSQRLRLGGAVIVRRLLNSADQGPYNTSFEDYRADAQIFPVGKIEMDLGFHQRDSDRLSPVPSTDFFDVSAAGETRVQDFTLQLGRTFAEGRLSLKAGGFYRRINYQDRFFVENNLHERGLLADISIKLDARTRLYMNWDLDSSFFLFTPNIKDSQVFRVGMAWKY